MSNTQIQRAISQNIKESGCHFQYVFSSGGESQEVFIPFFYTVGLTDIGLPEIIMISPIHPHLGHIMVINAVKKLKESGFNPTIDEGMIVEKVQLKGLPGDYLSCKLVELDEYDEELRDRYAVQLFEYYRIRNVTPRVLQLVLPDIVENEALPPQSELATRGPTH